jgi:ribonuclease III
MLNKNWLNKDIFQTAFTHRSYLNESPEAKESNERLEFLGDSVLSFIVSTYLYELRKNDTEGELTNLRSYIVKTPSLAKAAKNLDLGQILKLSKGEELSGGRENQQLLANTYEALIGALFIDQGVEKVKEFVFETLVPLFKDEIEKGPPKDAKSQLQEILQTRTKQSPQYKILSTSGPDHAKEFVVGVFSQGKLWGKGKGLSKQVAEEEAAEEALINLDKNNQT